MYLRGQSHSLESEKYTWQNLHIPLHLCKSVIEYVGLCILWRLLNHFPVSILKGRSPLNFFNTAKGIDLVYHVNGWSCNIPLFILSQKYQGMIQWEKDRETPVENFNLLLIILFTFACTYALRWVHCAKCKMTLKGTLVHLDKVLSWSRFGTVPR